MRATRAARFADLERDFEVAKASGKTHKIWRTRKDGDVRSSHAAMDGVRVDIDAVFDVNGARLFLPSDPEGPFDETANCRCFVEYVDEGMGEETFDDIRSVELATQTARLRIRYGVGFDDSLLSYPPERRAELFGDKLTERETLQNVVDFEAELDSTRALGTARGKDWTLGRLRELRTNLGDREPKSPEEMNRLGQVNARGNIDRLTEQTIVFKPELSARAAVGLNQPGKDNLNELVAELFAWYTSSDYDGGLDAEVETALDDLLR
ncbi:hypothetical protein AQ1_02452 [alpha proteobacterium Q-1]|nr:hypothetical protein AQ1_02452 [alpha proteobacterium Q-1]